jgi:hypothetical protein
VLQLDFLDEGDEVLATVASPPKPSASSWVVPYVTAVAPEDTTQVRVTATISGVSADSTDYLDGAVLVENGLATPGGVAASEITGLTLLMRTNTHWTPAAKAEDSYYARLPKAEAQEKLRETAPDATDIRSATCSWHGTMYDQETGYFAVVQEDGDLADLVGERILVSLDDSLADTRSVVCYVHTTGEMDDGDLSLPRKAFAELGSLYNDSVPVRVQPMTSNPPTVT